MSGDRRRLPLPLGMCEVCETAPAEASIAAPMPQPSTVRADMCARCLGANVWPWHILIAITAANYGAPQAAPIEWRAVVAATLVYLQRRPDEFERDVAEARAMIERGRSL